MFRILLLCSIIAVLSLSNSVLADEESALSTETAPQSVWICESGNPDFLGEYAASSEHMMDDVPSYVNAKKKSIFRNRGFWYVGDILNWPVETHYRCVGAENCPYKGETPPIPGTWTLNRFVGKAPAPVLSTTACEATAVDEL